MKVVCNIYNMKTLNEGIQPLLVGEQYFEPICVETIREFRGTFLPLEGQKEPDEYFRIVTVSGREYNVDKKSKELLLPGHLANMVC